MSVGTTKRSIAAICGAWLRRKVAQLWDGGPRRRTMYLATVDWARLMPSLRSSPWQNGPVERLIGSIRRECLDHVLVLGEGHLRRILSAYAGYDNGVRTHLALGKDAPLGRAIQDMGRITAVPLLGGLHHQYVRT